MGPAMTDLALPVTDTAEGCLCCEHFLLPVLVGHPRGLFCYRKTDIQSLCEYSIFVSLLLCQTPDWNRLVGLEITRSVIACLASYGKQAKNKPVYDLHKFYSNQNTQKKKRSWHVNMYPYAGKQCQVWSRLNRLCNTEQLQGHFSEGMWLKCVIL